MLMALVSCMRVEKTLRFTQAKPYHYMARFAVGEDTVGHFSYRMKFEGEWRPQGDAISRLELMLLNDREWDEALQTQGCEAKSEIARQVIRDVRLPVDGEWSRWGAIDIRMVRRSQVWYLFVSDCEGKTHRRHPDMPKIRFELKTLNDGSHFSSEEEGVLFMHVIMLVLFLYFLGVSGYKFWLDLKLSEAWETPLGLLIVALLLEIGHLGFNIVHLTAYAYDGDGIMVFKVFAIMNQVMSQLLTVYILLLMAYGWTISYHGLQEKDIYLIVGIFSLVVHVMIAGLTFVDDGEHHKYHDFSGFQGAFLVFLRLLLLAGFFYGISETRKEIPRHTQGFLSALSVTGTLYMLGFPFLYAVSYVCEPYVRNRVVVFGLFAVQGVSMWLMMHQFSKKNSKYLKASKRSQGILDSKFQ